MKNIFLTIVIILPILLFAQVGIGVNSPHPSASLEVASTEKGVLPPRMTEAQRDAIAPVEGLIIYNLDTHCLEFWSGTQWVSFCDSITDRQFRYWLDETEVDGAKYLYLSNGTDTEYVIENLQLVHEVFEFPHKSFPFTINGNESYGTAAIVEGLSCGIYTLGSYVIPAGQTVSIKIEFTEWMFKPSWTATAQNPYLHLESFQIMNDYFVTGETELQGGIAGSLVLSHYRMYP